MISIQMYYKDSNPAGQYKSWFPDGQIHVHCYFIGQDQYQFNVSLRNIMSLLSFKNRLRLRYRKKIVNKCDDIIIPDVANVVASYLI